MKSNFESLEKIKKGRFGLLAFFGEDPESEQMNDELSRMHWRRSRSGEDLCKYLDALHEWAGNPRSELSLALTEIAHRLRKTKPRPTHLDVMIDGYIDGHNAIGEARADNADLD